MGQPATLSAGNVKLHSTHCSHFQRGWRRGAGLSHLGLHPSPPLLLLLASAHVLVVLFGLRERLQKLVEDPEELVRLQAGRVLAKVGDRLLELKGKKKKKVKGHYKVICLILEFARGQYITLRSRELRYTAVIDVLQVLTYVS